MTPLDRISMAIKRIQEQGWVQNQWVSKDERGCLVASLMLPTEQQTLFSLATNDWFELHSHPLQETLRALGFKKIVRSRPKLIVEPARHVYWDSPPIADAANAAHAHSFMYSDSTPWDEIATEWNDAPHRTQEEVLQRLEAARDALLAVKRAEDAATRERKAMAAIDQEFAHELIPVALIPVEACV